MNRLLLILLGAVLASVLSSSPSSDYRDDNSDESNELALGAIPIKDLDNDDVGKDKSAKNDAENEKEDDKSSSSETESEREDKNGEKEHKAILMVTSKNFSCLSVKSDLVTGTSVDALSPQDIDIVAAMGDGLSTGIGLWEQSPLEFRGAVFSIGGDASVDGLITIPNILRKFNANLSGESHGIGTLEQLPQSQLNVAVQGATSSALLSQAQELSRRLTLRNINLNDHWVLISIAIGSDELCATCAQPNADILEQSMTFLSQNIPKALVVMIGPLDFWSHDVDTSKLLRNRCPCFKQKSTGELKDIYEAWKTTLLSVEEKFNNNSKFGVLTAPFISLTATEDIFLNSSIHFNRQGHSYAAKWLWNRLLTGSSTENSSLPSHGELICPMKDCPYFRTVANAKDCKTWKHSDTIIPVTTPNAVTISGQLAPKHESKKKKATMLYLVALTVTESIGNVRLAADWRPSSHCRHQKSADRSPLPSNGYRKFFHQYLTELAKFANSTFIQMGIKRTLLYALIVCAVTTFVAADEVLKDTAAEDVDDTNDEAGEVAESAVDGGAEVDGSDRQEADENKDDEASDQSSESRELKNAEIVESEEVAVPEAEKPLEAGQDAEF
uniref:Phospholipase B1, membrane-associated n=1 Tax=Plectus sambesii TaxID=2011161 RepID=A0A914WKV0_9BILA